MVVGDAAAADLDRMQSLWMRAEALEVVLRQAEAAPDFMAASTAGYVPLLAAIPQHQLHQQLSDSRYYCPASDSEMMTTTRDPFLTTGLL